jgi:hypothetical protein
VDTVRNQENRALGATGDKSLAGSKYLWLYSAENLPDRHADRFAALRSGDLKTARAWAIKESLRHFWSYKRRSWAAKHFKRWYFWATHSRLKPIIDAAKTLKRHEAGLLSYFAHQITNAGAEGLNSRVQAIRVTARGYRNREHFKTRSTSTSAAYNSTRLRRDPQTSRKRPYQMYAAAKDARVSGPTVARVRRCQTAAKGVVPSELTASSEALAEASWPLSAKNAAPSSSTET